jgi:enoyl-CoA hydratase/carnithine racemase
VTGGVRAPVDGSVAARAEGGVLTLTLNRPERLNALDAATADGLLAALHEAAGDIAVRCVVLTGAGRAFCAGADISADLPVPDLLPGAVVAHTPEAVPHTGGAVPMLDRANALAAALAGVDAPVIAAVNGTAAGLGTSIALACDLIVMADTAQILLGFASVGLMPDAGATYHLRERLGAGRALGMALLGDRLDATTALTAGLANRVFGAATFAADVDELARDVAAAPAAALRSAKAALRRDRNPALLDALDLETREQLTLIRACGFPPSEA